ncbi:MAG: hypothetical protein ABL871_03835 [Terricaulis sp.]
MTQDELHLALAEWLRKNAGLNIEGESELRVFRAIRDEFVSDTSIFASEGALVQALTALHQTPVEQDGRWRWHPRLIQLSHFLGILAVQRWIETKPGPIVAETVDELWQLALSKSGKNVSLPQVQAAFKEFGLTPEKCISSAGSCYVLAVPSAGRVRV